VGHVRLNRSGNATDERLHQLLGAYCHQDWPLEGDDWPAVAALYLRHVGGEEARTAAAALDALLGSVADDGELARIVHDELGCEYDPRPELGGPTLREWLGKVAEAPRRG
jgi:hypothetical protein